MSRTGLLELRDAEGLAHDLRDGIDALDSLVPLGDGPEHAARCRSSWWASLWKRSDADLARQHDHGRVVEEGVSDAGDEVRGPGPRHT